MNKRLKIGLIAGGALLLLGGIALFFWLKFKATDVHLRLIPKESSSVAVINIRNLFTKADPQKLMALPLFKQGFNAGNMSPEMKSILSDPTNLGADLTQNLAGFIHQDAGAASAGLVFKINDGSQFATVVAKLGGYPRPNRVDGLWYIPVQTSIGICWNDDAGIVFMGNPTSELSTQQQAEQLLRQSKENSILDNPNYIEFAKQNFDIGLMVDNALINSNESNDMWSDVYNMFGSTKGWSDMLVNFEANTIDIRSTNHQGDGQVNVMRATGSEAKHFEALGDKNPILFLNLALDVKALLQQLQAKPTTKRDLDGVEDMLDMKISDLVNSFTGDVSFALTDYRQVLDEDSSMQKLNRMLQKYRALENRFSGEEDEEEAAFSSSMIPVFVVNMSIKDTAVPALVLRKAYMKKNEAGFYFAPINEYTNVYAALNGTHFIITNSFSVASELMKNGKLNGKVAPEANVKNSLCGYMDLNISNYPAPYLASTKEEIGDRNYKTMLQLVAPLKYASLKNENNSNLLQVHIQPGEGNSLYRLIVNTAESISKF